MALPQVVLPTYELEIPSNGKKIKYRPFVVKEEKLLLLALESEDEKEIEKAVKQLLKSCIQSRIKIEELPIFDLEVQSSQQYQLLLQDRNMLRYERFDAIEMDLKQVDHQ